MLNKKKSDETLAELVRNTRKEKGLSARKLANLLNLSHTEINNIESGYRVKPSIIVLKGLEQYLGIPFSKSAKLVGYSKETIKYGKIRISNLKQKQKKYLHIYMQMDLKELSHI